MALLGGSPQAFASGASHCVDLLGLQVFAKQSIRGARSDFLGPTAAGRDVELTDFKIGGDLTAGNSIVFTRGRVQGLLASPRRRVSSVSSDGDGAVADLQLQRAAARLDALSRAMADLPATRRAVVSEEGSRAAPTKVIGITAERALDVVDLDAADLVSPGPDRLHIRIDGGEDARLLVRVHGASAVVRDVGFLLARGMDESRVLFQFPDATDLLVARSGGAISGTGHPIGIPGSVVAPDATLRFGSALITGQVFVKAIEPLSDAVTGQVDPVGAEQGRSGFVTSQVMLYVDRTWTGSCARAASAG